MMRTKTQILLVEDDPGHITLIRRAFRWANWSTEVTEARTLQEAQSYLRERVPHLVIADLFLPDGDAFTLLAPPLTPQAYPVVLMTAYGVATMTATTLKMGASHYVAKTHQTLLLLPYIAQITLLDWQQVMAQETKPGTLDQADQMLQLLLDHSYEGVATLDRTGQILSVNRAWLGLKQEAIIGTPCDQYFYPIDGNRLSQCLTTVVETGAPLDCETKSINDQWFICRLVPINQTGQVDAVLLLITNSTQSNRTQAALSASEEKYRTLFDLAGDAFLTIHRETIVEANQAAAHLLGYAQADLIGLSAAQVIAPEVLAETSTAWVRQLQEQDHFLVETLWVRKDGSRVPVAVSGKPLRVHGQLLYQLIGRDITAQKRSEALQSRRTQALQSLYHASLELNDPSDLPTLFKTIARCASRLRGARLASLLFLGSIDQTFVAGGEQPLPVPDEIIRFGQKLAGRVAQRETTLVATVDQPGIKKIAPESDRPSITMVGVPLKEADHVSGVLCLYGEKLRFDGDHLHLLKLFAAQASLAIQNARLFQQLHQELGERQVVEAQLHRALTEKETLLKEVHHRVNNNLQIMTSLLNLQADFIHDEQTHHLFEDSQGRIHAMALAYQHLYQHREWAKIELKPYLQKLGFKLLNTYQRIATIQLDVVVDDQLYLSIDQAVPCGLIINELVSNALKYAFPEGRPGQITVILRVTNAGQIALTVRDDGVGLPVGFEMHHPRSLGLQLVNILVHQLQGMIELKSNPGTIFQVTFPHV